ncbi:MAG: hypothetical protein AAF266_16035 [Planctomycetota bacterium]
MLRRLLLVPVLLGGFTLVPTADAEAGIFGRKGRVARSAPTNRMSRGRGYAVRGPGPLTIRVSSANYRRLTTFYPNVYRPR